MNKFKCCSFDDPELKDNLLNPIFDEDDLEEGDYDGGDDDEEDEEDNNKETETHRCVVQLTPPSNPSPSSQPQPQTPYQHPFGPGSQSVGSSGYTQSGTYSPGSGFQSTRPFGTTTPNTYTSPYQPSNTFGSNNWGFGSTGNGGFGSSFGSSFANRGTQTWGNNGNNGLNNYRKINVPRNCRILFCEMDDVLVGPKWYSPGFNEEIYGLDPRGVYDLVPKFPVWDVIRQMNPEYVFIISNQPEEPGTIAAQEKERFIEDLESQLARFLRLPGERCRSFVKFGLSRTKYTKPHTGLLTEALRSVPGVNKRFTRDQVYMMGAQSGGLGESDVDLRTAQNFGIQYIPVRGIVG